MGTLSIASTDPVAPSDRLAAWGEMVWQLLGRLRSDTYGDQHFRGHLEYADIGELRLGRLSASRHRVVRTPDLIRKDDRGFLKLVVKLRGNAWFEQNSRRVMLHPGEWSIYDTMRAYTVANVCAIEQLVLLIPRGKILVNGLRPDDLMVQRYSARSGIGRLAYQFMSTAFDEIAACSSVASDDIADTIAHLVRHSLLERAGECSPLAARESLRDRIKNFIDAHLRDPQLSIDDVAQACNCGKRNLHKVFRDEGTTISQYLWQQRLARCRNDLDNPELAGRSITDIAYSWGFNSSTHFSRAFKEEFGVSPRLYRLAAQGGTIAGETGLGRAVALALPAADSAVFALDRPRLHD